MNLATLFREEGIRVIEEGDWSSRVRPGGFDPIGIVNHHTGAKREASDGNVVKLLIDGRSDLAGPLCSAGIMVGALHLISGGRANHAGKGYSGVADRVRKDLPPWGREKDLPPDDIVGNGLFYGFEVDHPGDSSPYPVSQIDIVIKANTALCRYYKWSPFRCIHHAEWTDRKIDMSWRGDLRGMVAYRLDHARKINGVWVIPDHQDPIPKPEDPMALEKAVLVSSSDDPAFARHIYAISGGTRVHMKSWDAIRAGIAEGQIAGDGTLKTVKNYPRKTVLGFALVGDEEEQR